eukprot:9950353-Ditylum_brightwellii.AAC.1
MPTLNTFTLETLHYIRANTAFTDCDARACYSRMIAIITGLALHKARLPLHASSYFIKDLKQIKYYMLTAYGSSTQTNFHSPDNPIHGHGQGATCDPPSGNFNSDIILKIYSKEAHGCNIKDLTENIPQKRDTDMFVGNQTMQHNGRKYDNDEKTLMQLIHNNINLWDNL